MKTNKQFRGNVIPVITPLTAKYQLDTEAVERIFANLYANKAMPFILGTTGESPSLSAGIKYDYLREASRLKKADSLLYVGISGNSLEETIEMGKRSLDAGANALVATLPAYYNLTTDQMKRYFTDLADQVAGPLIVYNIPATTHMSIPLDLLDELSYHEHIVGTKDSERSKERLDQSLALWASRADFSHFLGWAAQSAYALFNGTDGLVPSTGNLLPDIYCEMVDAVSLSDEDRAYRFQHLSDAFGNVYQADRLLGESLAALKVLMQEAGLCQPYMMSPLQELGENEKVSLKQALYALMDKEGIKLNKYNHV
ncbi:dihydrodipicolinate synthase family protein [Mucilaginibacter lacusdianchii]|uniref:dihydrodipicolinate synthase family protein n=1 Tax=Mucilaginibacter lacusdianchii TaxID=2684211 RepID=UPI00131CB91B|nr:dihydrodipicolinate synthase family protein [Mucilaginibacter sp. JXJ CY 39]